MTIKQIAALMRENSEYQKVCIQDSMENVSYIGTLADLERNFPKAMNAKINTMYTERYGAFNGVSGLTFVIE